MMALIMATPTGASVDHGTTAKNVTSLNQSRAVATIDHGADRRDVNAQAD
jgi:hypothetical protein